jgi:hypothetical protein
MGVSGSRERLISTAKDSRGRTGICTSPNPGINISAVPMRANTTKKEKNSVEMKGSIATIG